MKELKLRQRQLTEINGRIDEKQEETDAVELQQNRLNHERRILEGRRTGWEEQLAGHERAIRNATRHVEEVESGINASLPKLPPCKVKSKVSAARYSTRCSDS